MFLRFDTFYNYSDFRIGLITTIAFFVALFGYSQNMVPNPSFETLDSSPSCWSLGGKADFDARMADWELPNEGTTDILSTLLSETCMTALPSSTYPAVDWFPNGNQNPRTGTNVVGIKPLSDSRREYLEVKLTCDMIPGETYYCEMYVSLPEKINYAQNSLAMYFSDTLVYVNSTARLDFVPQIVATTILEDTVQWMKISGTFTASSAHRYLLIGNFEPTANTQTKFLGNKGLVNFPYYYIDDVLVKQVSIPALTINGDSIVCKGDPAILQASGWPNPIWTAASGQPIGLGTQLTYVPKTSTTISVKATACSWSAVRKISLVVQPLPKVDLGKDTSICTGTSILLDATKPEFVAYAWQNGSSIPTITAVAGNYSVLVTDTNGCKAIGKKNIRNYNIPKVSLGEDIESCSSTGTLQPIVLGNSSDTYLWQNLNTSKQFEYSGGGTYWVTVKNVCGDEASDTVHVKVLEFKFPTLITDNGDGKNDTYQIQGTATNYGKFTVYNRYGDNVYSDSHYKQDWSGKNLSEGVYYFLYEHPNCSPVKGWVEIVR